MHAKINPEIRRALFFLKGSRAKGFDVAGVLTDIVSDNRANLIMPLAKPLSMAWFFPNTFIVRDYQRLLRPIRYKSSDAWWLKARLADDPRSVDPADYEWGHLQGGSIVADRGILISDLMKAAESYRCSK